MVSLEDALDAMRDPGCPVCRLSSTRVERFLDRLIYEHVNDAGVREALRASQGFCARHAYQLAGMPNSPGLGLALVYREIIQDISLGIPTPSGESSPTSAGVPHAASPVIQWMRRFLIPRRGTGSSPVCPACAYASKIEHYALRALLAGLDQESEGVAHSLAQSDGLCCRHLRQGINLGRRSPAACWLARDAQHRLHGLDQDLADYIQHQDYRFRDAEPGPWASAWRRALSFVHGSEDA